MRLYKPPTSLAYSAIKESLALLTCTAPATSEDVSTAEKVLTFLVKSDDDVKLLNEWTDRIFEKNKSLKNCIYELAVGKAALKIPGDRTTAEKNLISFFNMFKAPTVPIDLRTGEIAVGVQDSVDDSMLTQFTKDYQKVAVSIMKTIPYGIREVLKGSDQSSLMPHYDAIHYDSLAHRLLLSGMLSPLVKMVMEDSDPSMADLPTELLHAMYFDILAKYIPNVSPFDTPVFDTLRGDM